MKTFTQLLLLTIMPIVAVIGQSDVATIKVSMKNGPDTVLIIKQTKPTSTKDTVKVNPDGTFTYTAKGLTELQDYILQYGQTRKQSQPIVDPQTGMTFMSAYQTEIINLKLVKGFDLQISFDTKDLVSSLSIKGKGEEINNYVAQFNKYNQTFTNGLAAMNRLPKAEYLQKMDQFEKDRSALMDKYLTNPKSVPPSFLANERKELQFQIAARKSQYARTQVAIYKNDSIINQFDNEYFAYVNNMPFNNEELLDESSYKSFVNNYTDYLIAKQTKGVRPPAGENNMLRYQTQKSLFSKWHNVRDLVLYDNLYRNSGQYQEEWYKKAAADFNTIAGSDSLKEELAHIEVVRKALGKGNPAPEFAFPDINGNIRKLSDFRGQYVLVDVWATWCKPCVAEIPALEKAQEEYAGKKIVFISVNTGDLEERWKNYVQKNHLGGVQLWEGKQPPNTGFKRDYLIKGIPRFMLIDPEGKFVEGNAPRPSYVEFRAMMSRIKDKL